MPNRLTTLDLLFRNYHLQPWKYLYRWKVELDGPEVSLCGPLAILCEEAAS